MGYVTGLACKECGKVWPKEPIAACADCWGPLEAVYDMDGVRRSFRPETIAGRPRDLWRYHELLPIDGDPTVGRGTGFTPLLPAPRLGALLGIRDLWIKYDAACHPTLSFKDRLVAVALSKAREFGMETVGCASTGNLANAVAAGAAAASLRAVVLVPVDLEAAKLAGTAVYGATLVGVRGNYDRVNRLCTEIADRFGWGLVNVNLRAYYGEGSKTVGFELAEQMGWKLPRHVVCPMAGASLITKVDRAFRQLGELGLVEGRPYALHGAQPSGCAPVVRAWKDGLDRPPLVKPSTIVRSLSIGDPADGPAALATIRRTEGRAEEATDPEVIDAMRLLAQSEGLFAETAGGTVVAAARRLARDGAFAGGGSVVLLITGHGLKTVEALAGQPPFSTVIDGRLAEFEEFWSAQEEAPGARAGAQAGR
ncbi:MAG TPA: threonine synthase [Vicinamibacteria bacterium]|nr:threonine synthase [Vicinamibacteria bacterium]